MEKPPDRENQLLRQKEINSLRSMVSVISKYAESLRKAHDEKTKEGFYDIVEEAGYKVEEVPIGHAVNGPHNEVTRENSVRIGKDKTLFINHGRRTIKTKEDQRKAAIAFANHVS